MNFSMLYSFISIPVEHRCNSVCSGHVRNEFFHVYCIPVEHLCNSVCCGHVRNENFHVLVIAFLSSLVRFYLSWAC
jgi:hypothetical protein